jgi:ERCC4-type nuclease
MKILTIEIDTKEPDKISKITRQKIIEFIQYQTFNNPKFDKEGIKFKIVNKSLIAGDLKCMNLGVERKTIYDFLASIKDKRYINQIERKMKQYKYRYVLVSGKLENIKRDQDRRAILTASANAEVFHDIRVQFLPNDEYLVHYFLMLCLNHSKELKSLELIDIPPKTEHDAISSLMGNHGIGEVMAKNLLVDNDTLRNVYNASKEQLMKTYRVGDKLASKIIETATKQFGDKDSNRKGKEGNRTNQKQITRTNYSRPTRQHINKGSSRTTKYKQPIRQTRTKNKTKNSSITNHGSKRT